MSKKEIINDTIAQKKAEIERLFEQLRAVSEGSVIIEERLSGLRPLLSIDRLDRHVRNGRPSQLEVTDSRRIEYKWRGAF